MIGASAYCSLRSLLSSNAKFESRACHADSQSAGNSHTNATILTPSPRASHTEESTDGEESRRGDENSHYPF